MRFVSVAGAAFAFGVAISPATAGDDTMLTRLMLCQDSWLDWSTSDPGKLKAFADDIRANFTPSGNDPFVLPKGAIAVAGLRVAEAYPQSIGMAVGFSITVDAPFDKARAVIEKALGKALGKCESSDGMKTCMLQIADKRTVTLMAEDDAKATKTLAGCYYFYEK